MTKRITTLHYKGRTFEIVFDGKYYLAIEHCFLDEKGRLTKTLDGLDMCADEELENTIARVERRADVDELEAQGMDRTQAVLEVYKRRTQNK